VLHGIADFSSSQKQPAQLNNAVDFLSSPEFLALQKMGAKFDAEAVEGATNAVTTNYNDKLIPAVRDEWRQAQTTVGAPQSVKQIGRVTIPVENKKPTTDALQYLWTGTSIQFKPAPGYETNPAVLAKARELQKSLAPLINKSVRMSAHLSGSDNYTKYFQQNEAAFFGEPSAQADVPQKAQSAKKPKSSWDDKYGGNPSDYSGMTAGGNIDLTDRPQVKMPDGSTATVRSMSFQDESGQEVLIPTVSKDGRIMEPKEAIDYYYKTGELFGKFKTPEEANKYAEELHNRQAKYYGIK